MILPVVLILLLISFIDIIFLRIPNCINNILFLYSIIYIICSGNRGDILGFLVGLAIFIIAFFLSKGLLGEGDVKLISSLGLIIGFPAILNLILYSSIISLIVIFNKKKRKAQVLPFAPFLSIAFIFILILQSSSF